MRNRLMVALVAGLLALTACSGSDGEGKIVMGARSDATTTAPTDGTSETPSPAEPGSDGTEPTDSGSDPSESVPSGSYEADRDKCAEVSQAFSQIAGQAATMTAADAQAALEQMKAVLPEELRDDMQTMVEAFSDPTGGGMTDQAFIDANGAVTNYLSQVCGAGG